MKNILNASGTDGIDSNSLVISFYKLKEALKIKDFSNTKYSNDHYKKIEKIIINSSELRKENFIEYLNHYLAYTDILFKKKIIENPNEVEIEKTKKYSEMYLIIENLTNNKKAKNIKNNFPKIIIEPCYNFKINNNNNKEKINTEPYNSHNKNILNQTALENWHSKIRTKYNNELLLEFGRGVLIKEMNGIRN